MYVLAVFLSSPWMGFQTPRVSFQFPHQTGSSVNSVGQKMIRSSWVFRCLMFTVGLARGHLITGCSLNHFMWFCLFEKVQISNFISIS